MSRLFYYGAICVALPVLRRRQPGGAWFRLPAGPLVAVVGVAICLVLLAGVDFSKSLILLATIAIALVNWIVVRKRPAADEGKSRHPAE